MAEQDATAVAITGGTINNTTIGATTATTGKFTSVTTPSVTATTNDLTLSAISTGAVNLATAGGTQFQIANTASTTNYLATTGSNGGTPALYSAGASTNIGTNIVSKGTSSVAFYTNGGVVQQVVSHTASAVNYVQITGAATGAAPTISAQGSDGNIFMQFNSKGTSGFNFYSGGGSFRQLRIDGANSSVNFLGIAGSVANQVPILNVAAASSDTNVSLAIQPKGTGAIDLAAGSSGVNISNGGTVTAITRTAAGSAYTSFPTMAISAPTTAGGVQATATFTMGLAGVPTITNGGTGYTVGNTLTFVGGSGGTATLTVSTVSSGVITGVTVAGFGLYTALPSNPISVTGGSGSGATFTATWAINSGFTITNAGSGYIEQPTITFSGGGGSGAAAYATVGSATIIRSLGNNLTINNPSGTSFAVSDAGATSAQWWQAIGGAFTGILRSTGSTQNGQIQTGGTGSIQLLTNNGAAEQFRIAHTASAVNYVQVTGGATGNRPTISAQGSDTNIDIALTPKGTGGIVGNVNSGTFTINRDSANNAIKFTAPNGNMYVQTTGGGVILFNTADGSAYQMRVNHTASSVNYVQVTGGATGNSPAVSVAGSDANLDLTLTPKGTGLIRFGTYVAGALLATGYINIKAADGTTYKVLVST
jgi:hypothetical protein